MHKLQNKCPQMVEAACRWWTDSKHIGQCTVKGDFALRFDVELEDLRSLELLAGLMADSFELIAFTDVDLDLRFLLARWVPEELATSLSSSLHKSITGIGSSIITQSSSGRLEMFLEALLFLLRFLDLFMFDCKPDLKVSYLLLVLFGTIVFGMNLVVCIRKTTTKQTKISLWLVQDM